MFSEWKSDLKSSLVVFLVALPLCLGIALASNAPMSAGLFAGIIGGIVVGALSGSHVGVSGPAAGLTVIVLNGITQLGSFEIFASAVFLAGLFQVLFGLIRGGMIGNFFPTAVVRGMLAAIGLILIIKQYPNALGLIKGGGIQYGILIISLISLGIMLFWEKMAYRGLKFFKVVPGALIAVGCSIIINALYQSYFPALTLGAEYLVQMPFMED
jgi:MFS superfamily sulfate permease-like transporter